MNGLTLLSPLVVPLAAALQLSNVTVPSTPSEKSPIRCDADGADHIKEVTATGNMIAPRFVGELRQMMRDAIRENAEDLRLAKERDAFDF